MAYDVLFLSQDDVKSLGITMDEMLKEIELGWKLKGEGKVELPPKPGVHPRENCYIHAMPCWIGGEVDTAGLKWVAGFPQNLAKKLPYNNGIFCLNDTDTGVITAIMDANWMTTWRTGAASGVGAKYLASPGASTMSVIGLGTIGKITLRAIKTALPGIKDVKVYDPLPAQVDAYIAEMRAIFTDLNFVKVAGMQEACADTDIVTSSAPIVENPSRPAKAGWLKKDALVITTDYDSTFDAETASKAEAFVCDDRGQYLWTQEHGVYFQNGYPQNQGIYADMGEICAGIKKPVTSGRRTCVFMGIASHDVMTARLILKKAKEAKIGQWLKL